jgi:site-specific recombinase XerD
MSEPSRLPTVGTPQSTHLDLARPGVNLLVAYLHRFDRPQTRRAYENDLTRFFGTAEIDISLARRATFLHVNEHIAELEREGLKATTIRRRISAIRGFFDWLEALELVDRNPAHKQLIRRVRTVSRRDQTIVVLTAAQAESLVTATNDSAQASVRDRAMILTMLHCVLRRSEVSAMDFEHVRPLGRYWVLDIPESKGGADQYVKIPDHVVEEIDEVRREYGYSSGAVWRSLSNNSRGNRLTPESIYRIVKASAVRAGLDVEIGAHTLRHTGCTLAIDAGATLQQVKDHARHKKIETTMVYIHQRDRLRDSAADYINVKKR